MMIRSMRWGYDDRGPGHGPVERDTVVEICVTGDDGCNYFVTLSRVTVEEHVRISEMPLFDILIQMKHRHVNADHEMEKIQNQTIEEYEFHVMDPPGEMAASAFAKVIHLARLAMRSYYFKGPDENDAASAMRFIRSYVGVNLNRLVLPDLELD